MCAYHVRAGAVLSVLSCWKLEAGCGTVGGLDRVLWMVDGRVRLRVHPPPPPYTQKAPLSIQIMSCPHSSPLPVFVVVH